MSEAVCERKRFVNSPNEQLQHWASVREPIAILRFNETKRDPKSEKRPKTESGIPRMTRIKDRVPVTNWDKIKGAMGPVFQSLKVVATAAIMMTFADITGIGVIVSPLGFPVLFYLFIMGIVWFAGIWSILQINKIVEKITGGKIKEADKALWKVTEQIKEPLTRFFVQIALGPLFGARFYFDTKNVPTPLRSLFYMILSAVPLLILFAFGGGIYHFFAHITLWGYVIASFALIFPLVNVAFDLVRDGGLFLISKARPDLVSPGRRHGLEHDLTGNRFALIWAIAASGVSMLYLWGTIHAGMSFGLLVAISLLLYL